MLTTERLLLRQLVMEDGAAVQRLRGNKEVMKYNNRPLTLTLQEAESWIKIVLDELNIYNGITWCICLKDTPSEHVGSVGIWRIDKENHRGEIGYMIEPALQGKGFMYEALQPVIQYGFNTLLLHSMEAQIDPRNTASAALLNKAGFVQEALFKESYLLDDEFVDTAVYSLLTPKRKATNKVEINPGKSLSI